MDCSLELLPEKATLTSSDGALGKWELGNLPSSKQLANQRSLCQEKSYNATGKMKALNAYLPSPSLFQIQQVGLFLLITGYIEA